MVEPDVLDGRDCGSCNVCCVALTIDDADLQKPQGYRCRNAQSDNSCAIYPTRPATCRNFNCGWRVLRFVKITLRPDQSGVLIRLHREITAATGAERMGIIVTLLNSASIKAEGLAETIAAAVAAGLPVFLNVPGPPGFTSGLAKINDTIAHAVATKDKPGLLRLLQQARQKGLKGDHRPIRLKPREPEPSAHADTSPPDPA